MEEYKKFAEKVPVLGFVIKWLGGNDLDYGGLLAVFGVLLLLLFFLLTPVSFWQVFIITAALSPIWVTYFLAHLFYSKWMDQVGKNFALNNGRTTLRIKLPPEVFKSPEAMEFVISQIHNTANPDNLMQTYLQGKRPLNFSFEIVSIGGDVRFYANVPTSKTKPALEANLYAQYPGVEVIEEPVDYTAEIPLGSPDWDVMSFHMGKKKDQEYPIKTYIDSGLDKLPKEEEKVDPITPMLEILGNISPQERVYIQYVCKPFRPESFKNGQLVRKEGPSWEKGVHKIINDMMKRDEKGDALKNENAAADSPFTEMLFSRLTDGERKLIEIMERNASKYAYDTGIRWMYLAKKGHFNGDNISPVIRSFSQWDIIGRNAVGARWRTDAGYKDFFPNLKKQIDGWKKQEHSEYKRRLYFNKSRNDGTKIFTAEELASLWHLPGKVALTPSLGRIESARSEAPSNLPIGQ